MASYMANVCGCPIGFLVARRPDCPRGAQAWRMAANSAGGMSWSSTARCPGCCLSRSRPQVLDALRRGGEGGWSNDTPRRFNLAEHLERIDRQMAYNARLFAADVERRHAQAASSADQERCFWPILLAVAGMTVGAACLGASVMLWANSACAPRAIVIQLAAK